MYPIPPTEKLIETKNCRHCGVSFPITDKDIEFYEKVSPVFNGQKYPIPTPTLCPDCRQQRRLSFRNERKLYKRKCDATGRDIISIYAPCEMKGSMEVPLGCSPDKPFKVYHQDFWWSDKWDPMDYGRDFDFERGFFEQFGELMREVPRISLININCENSEYNNGIVYSKNAYLNFDGGKLVDSNYTTSASEINKSNDVWWSSQIDNSYEIVFCDRIYNSIFCYNCSQGVDLLFCEECVNCSDCIMCYGLKNKKYFIQNNEYSKKEYFEYKNKLITGNYGKITEFRKEFKNFLLKQPRKNLNISLCEKSSGDYVFESKNCIDCNTIVGGEDSKDVFEGGRFLGIMSSCFVYDSKYIMDSLMIAENSYNIFFSSGIGNSNNIYYSISLECCSFCFGCTGLRNKSYCILNKQYTKEEYEILIPKIIEHIRKAGEWGEFFPSSLSPFGYNETVAMEYYPLDRRDTLQYVSTDGKSIFNWSDYEAPFPRVEKIIPAVKLPEDIAKIPDDILNWAIECEVTGKPFRIIKQELEFYRKHNLPIPRRHPDQRHLDRMSLRNPRKLFERKCDKCGVGMMTTYSSDRPEVVYCEGCYNKEIL